MPRTPSHAVLRALRAYGPKLLRYTGVTVVNVITGLSLLVFFHAVLGWPGVAANAAAVILSTIPAYILSRKWVWAKSGPNSFRSEVAPFWGLAFAGLVISTAMVGWASSVFDNGLVVYAANIASFGVLWVVKFFVLEKLLWSNNDAAAPVRVHAVPRLDVDIANGTISQVPVAEVSSSKRRRRTAA